MGGGCLIPPIPNWIRFQVSRPLGLSRTWNAQMQLVLRRAPRTRQAERSHGTHSRGGGAANPVKNLRSRFAEQTRPCWPKHRQGNWGGGPWEGGKHHQGGNCDQSNQRGLNRSKQTSTPEVFATPSQIARLLKLGCIWKSTKAPWSVGLKFGWKCNYLTQENAFFWTNAMQKWVKSIIKIQKSP